jgi:outer membrane protein TolC
VRTRSLIRNALVLAVTASSVYVLSASADEVGLKNYLDRGIANSPRVAAARAQLGIARSELVAATTLPNPAILIDNQYQFTYKLGASFVVEPPWQIVFRRAAARQRITQADIELQRALWQFRGELRRAFVQAAIAREMTNLRKQLVQLTSQLWQVSKERFESGDVPRLDVHRAELSVVQAQIEEEQADIALTQATEQLNILIDSHSPAVEAVPVSSVAAEIIDTSQKLPSLEKLQALAIQHRPDLRLIEQQRNVAQADLKVARGNILPPSRFNFGVMTEDRINSDLNRKTWFFQSMIDLPIFNFQQGPISRLKATTSQLDLQTLAQRNIIVQQVALNYRAVQSALARIEKYRTRALTVSNTIATGVNLSYRMGQADITTALLAQQDNIAVRTQFLNSLLAYELAMNDLEQSVGIPLE